MSFRNSSHPVPVYDKDRTLKGWVRIQTTSVGAAKIAGTETAAKTTINGRAAWLGKDYR